LGVLIGLLIALFRRYIQKPDGIDSGFDDGVVLGLLLLIVITGFVLQALRIVGTQDPWAAWSPVGNFLANFFRGMSMPALTATHRFLWWFHLALAFSFIAYIPYGKLFHLGLAPLNIYCRSLEPKGTLSYIDMEDETAETFGVGKLEEFTWKDLLDTDACVRCGRCQNNCPAYLSGKPLSPKKLIQDLRQHLNVKGGAILTLRQNYAQKGMVQEEIAAADMATDGILAQTLVNSVVEDEVLWACTTCRSCMEQCPTSVEHVPKIVDMRRNQVLMESNFPSEAQLAFRNMENNGNPWGIGWQTRADWAKDLGVATFDEKPDAEYLYWPGCSGAFDSRNKKVSTALVKLLQSAGTSFAILGNAEKCCGDSARRMGNEYLYYALAQENIATMTGYGIKKIITQCPHCYNTLRNEYPQLGGEFEVLHHTEVLAELLRQGKLAVSAPIQAKVTYHDSCYLGRYNDIFAAPRDILSSAGAKLVEMERNYSKSFCCGAGGGRMWLEEKLGNRINEMRTEQALEVGADMVSTACPFCLTMLSDGIKSKDAAETLQAKDIAEVLFNAISCGENKLLK
ncbi:MAG: (Fe-S)-binding protein, partial [Peptococcaceae bacterium]|nr:(Fe-S)-binding protein [Peptococcaceae bacterium]